jgi:uncharacterized repeat protein (TIGR03843 family)
MNGQDDRPAPAPTGPLDDSHPDAGPLDRSALVEVLTRGRIDVQGRLAGASNATLYCTASAEGVEVTCVYKPVAGERPLWDFPDRTLGRREVATSLVSATVTELASDGIPGPVPLTVWRDDGPFGEGSNQIWIDVDDEIDLVDVVPPHDVPRGWRSVLRALGDDGRPLLLIHRDDPALRRMALIDIITNNSDRKGGHILPGIDGVVYGIDHGLCFNIDDKLRTVLWGWAGEELTDVERHLLGELAGELTSGSLRQDLHEHLSDLELEITVERIQRLVDDDALTHPTDGWPSIPWPAF